MASTLKAIFVMMDTTHYNYTYQSLLLLLLLFALLLSITNIDGSDTDFEDSSRQERGKHKYRKKYRRYLLPLLLAYKLKFFTLIPVMIGGLILLTGATGMAGFFFALFAAVMGLKSRGQHRQL
nr:unnamed protein product [Callosobruchus chinensis]